MWFRENLHIGMHCTGRKVFLLSFYLSFFFFFYPNCNKSQCRQLFCKTCTGQLICSYRQKWTSSGKAGWRWPEFLVFKKRKREPESIFSRPGPDDEFFFFFFVEHWLQELLNFHRQLIPTSHDKKMSQQTAASGEGVGGTHFFRRAAWGTRRLLWERRQDRAQAHLARPRDASFASDRKLCDRSFFASESRWKERIIEEEEVFKRISLLVSPFRRWTVFHIVNSSVEIGVVWVLWGTARD